MSLFRFIFRYYSSIKDEALKETWELSAPIAGTETVKYMVSGDQPMVIKKVANKEDFKNHISFYYKIVRRRIKTPKIFSKDRKNLMIKYEAIGIESNENNVWTKTLVNFKYDPEKEKSTNPPSLKSFQSLVLHCVILSKLESLIDLCRLNFHSAPGLKWSHRRP